LRLIGKSYILILIDATEPDRLTLDKVYAKNHFSWDLGFGAPFVKIINANGLTPRFNFRLSFEEGFTYYANINKRFGFGFGLHYNAVMFNTISDATVKEFEIEKDTSYSRFSGGDWFEISITAIYRQQLGKRSQLFGGIGIAAPFLSSHTWGRYYVYPRKYTSSTGQTADLYTETYGVNKKSPYIKFQLGFKQMLKYHNFLRFSINYHLSLNNYYISNYEFKTFLSKITLGTGSIVAKGSALNFNFSYVFSGMRNPKKLQNRLDRRKRKLEIKKELFELRQEERKLSN